jgi:bifunctional DNA-binding transcriptional regulator/antitoxin component of YhaV-PrlF toxin-antitoxin module
MALVAVKNKYQVVIPRKVREKVPLKVGDLLEARAEHGKVTFTPKSVVDRDILESFADFQEGRTYGPCSYYATRCSNPSLYLFHIIRIIIARLYSSLPAHWNKSLGELCSSLLAGHRLVLAAAH